MKNKSPLPSFFEFYLFIFFSVATVLVLLALLKHPNADGVTLSCLILAASFAIYSFVPKALKAMFNIVKEPLITVSRSVMWVLSIPGMIIGWIITELVFDSAMEDRIRVQAYISVVNLVNGSDESQKDKLHIGGKYQEYGDSSFNTNYINSVGTDPVTGFPLNMYD